MIWIKKKKEEQDTKMAYFRELPDVDYQSFLSDSISSKEYLRVKNLFRKNYGSKTEITC